MVSIDTVYQRVLALANKEQRGYITPQEFNLFANQAQMDIFEQYFYDLNQFKRIPGNDSIHADMTGIIEEKISIFHNSRAVNKGTIGFDLPVDYYRLMQVRSPGEGEIEKMTHRECYLAKDSPLTKPTLKRPIYYIKGSLLGPEPESRIIVSPNEISTIHINYIKAPVKVEWWSVNGLYNSTNSVDFELHPSEETKLVIKILGLAGITLKDPSLYQIAGAEDNKNIQQEKQ